MSVGKFTIEFWAEIPEPIHPGDGVKIDGYCTVKTLDAQLVNITGYGDDKTEVTLGDLEVTLFGNRVEVHR